MPEAASFMEWVTNYGLASVLSVIFIVMVWLLFHRWMKAQEAQDKREDARYTELVQLTKAVTEVTARNTTVMAGMQTIVEKVGESVDNTNRTLAELTTEMKDQKMLTNKMFTELRVQGERSKRGG